MSEFLSIRKRESFPIRFGIYNDKLRNSLEEAPASRDKGYITLYKLYITRYNLILLSITHVQP